MRYVYRDGQVIPRHMAKPRIVSRSDLPSPYIRPDGMSDLRNHADGLLYDSKSAYYKAVRQAGCEIVGDDPSFNEPQTAREMDTPGGIEQDLKNAIEQLGG